MQILHAPIAGLLLASCLHAFAAPPEPATRWDRPAQDRNTIAKAEAALEAQGYEPGRIDGQMDPKTVEAVRQAQQDRELQPTGRLDRRTAAALGVPNDPRSSSAGSSGRAPR